jgi:hypothetical protein
LDWESHSAVVDIVEVWNVEGLNLQVRVDGLMVMAKCLISTFEQVSMEIEDCELSRKKVQVNYCPEIQVRKSRIFEWQGMVQIYVWMNTRHRRLW